MRLIQATFALCAVTVLASCASNMSGPDRAGGGTSQLQLERARVSLEMAARTNSNYAPAQEGLGDIYTKLAIQAYTKTLQLDGNNTAVASKLAVMRPLFSADAQGQNVAGAAPTRAYVAPMNRAVAAPVVPMAASPVPAMPVVPAAPPASVIGASASNSAAFVPAAPSPAPVVAAVAPAPAPSSLTSDPSIAAGKEVEGAVYAWAKAWSAKDVATYLKAYGKDFATPGGHTRKAWEAERRNRIVSKTRISVKLSELLVDVRADKASVSFKQEYNADAVNNSDRKTLELVKEGGRWVIVKEYIGG